MGNNKRLRISYMLVILLSCIYFVGNKGLVVNAEKKSEWKSNDLFFYGKCINEDDEGNIKDQYVIIAGLAENADKNITTLTIPATIDGLPVKSVGYDPNSRDNENDNNFYKCKI